MSYLFFDTETTGLPQYLLPLDAASQPRIASIALVLTDEHGRPLQVHYQMVRPEGWEMPPEVARINGLTTEILRRSGQPIELVFHRLAELTAEEPVMVAHNRKFDLFLLAGEMLRGGFSAGTAHEMQERERSACTMELAKPICKLAPTNRMLAAGIKDHKPPSLMEATRHFFGEGLPDAHDCLFDALACRRIFFAIQKSNGRQQ